MHIDDGRHRVQEILPRRILIVDPGFRQLGLVLGRAGDPNLTFVPDLVQPVDARFDRHPLQQVHQPARRDGRELRNRLGRVRELPGGIVA